MAVHFKKLGASRSYRYECREFLCDGLKLLEDASNSDFVVSAVVTAIPIPFPLSVDTLVYHVDSALIESLSPLKNAQGLLFACKMRGQDSGVRGQETGDAAAPQEIPVNGGVHILLDNVQDPGNVGTIIRTANAFDVRTVLLYGACADAFNPKTIRASMGAIFRQNICKMDLEKLSGIRDDGIRFIGAAPSGDGRAVFDVDFENSIVVIGSEGSGLSPEIESLCSEKTTIPIAAGCESLNAAVAAAIIMWEAKARRSRVEKGLDCLRSGSQ